MASSKTDHLIDSKMQTATARRSGLSRMPRRLRLLFSSSRDSAVALVAIVDVSMVVEMFEDTEFVVAVVVVSDVGHPGHRGGE